MRQDRVAQRGIGQSGDHRNLDGGHHLRRADPERRETEDAVTVRTAIAFSVQTAHRQLERAIAASMRLRDEILPRAESVLHGPNLVQLQ
jgi:hypothetical protein